MNTELSFDEPPTTSFPASPLLFALAGLLVGAGLGAGLMFLLDPQSGRRRRALALERAVHLRTRGRDELEGRFGGLSGRSRDVAAALRSRLLVRERVNEATLAARVRARLGHVASNPAAIAVSTEGGRVTLRGTVPPDELDDVLDEVSAVHGVREVYNLLQVQLGAPPAHGHHH